MGHNGIDFGMLWSVPNGRKLTVHAPHDGVCYLGDQKNKGYGRYVRITSLPVNRSGHQRQSDLAHLEGYYIKHNQFVHAGEPIGYIQKGKTNGFSTGTHLHWTYKPLLNSVPIFENNGYNGAIDVSKDTLIWTTNTLA